MAHNSNSIVQPGAWTCHALVMCLFMTLPKKAGKGTSALRFDTRKHFDGMEWSYYALDEQR
jgi:hypothetical protein